MARPPNWVESMELSSHSGDSQLPGALTLEKLNVKNMGGEVSQVSRLEELWEGLSARVLSHSTNQTV